METEVLQQGPCKAGGPVGYRDEAEGMFKNDAYILRLLRPFRQHL